MAFWWASQNKNYRTAIPNGTLWTRPRVNGVLPRERAALQELEVDDIVFHYGNAHVRAVSRVVTAAVDFPRPNDYPRGPRESDENDDGKLVRVEVIADQLKLHRDRFREIITWGTPGPLTRVGMPREAYLTPLLDEDALAILAELDIDAPTRSLPGRPHENWVPGHGATDAEVITSIRKEQGALRSFLLKGRAAAPCAICTLILPTSMLIAGHIVPRAQLSDEQRHDYRSVAMLVCLLGCDALFESGYIVVTEDGHVMPGASANDPVLKAEIQRRVGGTSTAWTSHTAPMFRQHARQHGA
ncbi:MULTISPECIES: hypothetical protein [unclassified Frigoribacterium]|uniref:hypothetical protein n=1 Tax=unclassified Frigoribacterium TaxID=2627005 RepID=UPI00156603A5|nr:MULTISPECIES: hypothetical protein [unclassified Frigoribacterium]NQW87669.1 hypothetical protein [Frigoribacterium sp. VKM Ac-2860]NQX09522.1 hypothetical protein [Frigoribacterium sp. VKM Ac-2859]